ncbi:NAD-dependent epimerase/dehydratase family protein [Janibacter sp. GS2]|uniref:NAD-dependent epimerase/dehydratase family protein n=1 Tax=Janibacter sp. GS2 TaxID=3442646 RepID=UPI003EBA96BD
MTTRRILITGATGNVGSVLSQRLRDGYEVRRHGRTARPDASPAVLGADVTDYDDVRALMDGVDTVVHLAGSASPEAGWESVLGANIIGTRNVLEAARDAGVRRVVYASSNHVMGMYDRHEEWPVYPSHLPRPDSLYGVSKAFGETLGRYYHDEYGLSFIALRIGWLADDPTTTDIDLLHAMWLSEGDTERIVRCAIEAEIDFGIYYAISDNPNRRWDLTSTMLDLGYRPQDSWADVAPADEPVVERGEPVPDDWPAGS